MSKEILKVFNELIETIEKGSTNNEAVITNVKLWAESWKKEMEEALTIHNVVGRSEQLVAFLKWVGDGYDFENNAEKIVNEYISEGN